MLKIAVMMLLSGLIVFATLSAAYAAIDPASLEKVSGNTNPKCVEYYNYKGELYCSTSAQLPATVDPAVKDYETQIIRFDERPWYVAWGKKAPYITTVEYVPSGSSIDDWHELVTSQFAPGIQNKITPKKYADIIIQKLREDGYKLTAHFIEESPEQVIFEIQVESPSNMMQDEIQKVTMGKDGMYILHYAIKVFDMGQENRDKWIANLRNSKIKE